MCAQVARELETNCVVCGLSREVLDNTPHGFERHISHEHRLWNYLFFMMHLRLKPETEYTGQESYVHHQLLRRSYDFFPVGVSTDVAGDAGAGVHFAAGPAA